MEDNYTFCDIQTCSSFKTTDVDVKNIWVGPYFYEDEKAYWKPNDENLYEMAMSSNGVSEIVHFLKNNCSLTNDFCEKWHDKYSFLDDLSRIFNNKYFKYNKQVRHYLNAVEIFLGFSKFEQDSKSLLNRFIDFQIVNSENYEPWLYEAMKDFKYSKYGFEYSVDYSKCIVIIKGLPFYFKDIQYSHNLYTLVENYYSIKFNPKN